MRKATLLRARPCHARAYLALRRRGVVRQDLHRPLVHRDSFEAFTQLTEHEELGVAALRLEPDALYEQLWRAKQSV